ncbi:hypothetical protein M0R45_037131 [Rubus argutus]|uniref:Cyclic nucleotide-binding domain-containing protein n=1 Tax=Rubus argutus TaxID=59490 RepID=A0AAW1W1Z5_RUBAR
MDGRDWEAPKMAVLATNPAVHVGRSPTRRSWLRKPDPPWLFWVGLDLSHFIKQTTLPINNEAKLSTTFDRLATLKKVPKLEYMDETILEKFSTRLIPTRYNDVSSYIIEGELDKMFLIVSGLVSITSIKGGEKVYRYSGNYWGDELFEWALHPSRAYNHSLPKLDVCVEAVGDVEVRILKANVLIRLILELKFLRETGDDDINLFVQKKKTHMRLDTEHGKEEETRKASIEKKKGREVEWCLTKNGVPSSKQSEIMEKVLGKLEEIKDVDMQNILSILPSDLQDYLKSCVPLNRLKKVPLLKNLGEDVLTEISEYIVPKKYTKDEIIIQEKEPLQMMIFIVEGNIIIKKRDFPSTLKRSAGEAYGEKLLSWPEWTSFPTLPVATDSVKADGDVEALVLMARDMEDVGWKFRSYFSSKKITHLINDELQHFESARVTMLRKVPKLETMDTQVLQAISEKLKPMSCKAYTNIIREGKPLHKMVFVTEGYISLKKDGAWTNKKLRQGEFYGGELLDWVLDRSFPAIVPISSHGVWVDFNIDVLVLTAKDLGDVVSNFKSHFSNEIISPTDDSSLDLCATVGLTWLKKGPSIFRHMDEEVLKVISKHLELMSCNVDTYIIRENNPLEYMLIFIDGSSMSIKSSRRPNKWGLHNIGQLYGEELVHWVTNWAAHATFPEKLPLSTSNVKLSIDDTGNARVLVLWADDLKSIVSQFRSQFINQTTLPIDSEWQLSTFDPLATLKKVPLLADMDQKQLEKIRDSLIPKRYNDMSPYIIEGEFDKMFLIESGLVSITSIVSVEKVYRYSGNYCGDELLKRALHPSRASKSIVWVEAVGEVEALVIEADDLIRLVSEFNHSRV